MKLVCFTELYQTRQLKKKQDVKGSKLTKDRITVLLSCSAAREKLKPLVIGISAKNQFQPAWCPVGSSNTTWMNSKIFSDWLQKVNRKMKLHKRNILLFMDNVSSHAASEVSLPNVTVKFLPANTTSCTQLLDAGII